MSASSRRMMSAPGMLGGASRRCGNFARGLAALVCCLAAASAAAQQTSREQEQLRRLRLQVQQLQQAQAEQQDGVQRVRAEAAAAKTQLEASKAQLDAAQSELRRSRSAAAAKAQGADIAQKELDTVRQERSALQTRLDQLQAQLQTSGRGNETLRTAGTELQRQLALRDTAYADLAALHTVQAQGLQTCIASNLALRDVGHELLQRYASKTVADVMAQNEPFLQIRRVAMENLLQGYQDKLDQHALQPARATPATPVNREQPQEPARAP